jgi:hypothetical protein
MKMSNLNPAPKRIMAIDASTNSLAFSIFDGGKLECFGKVNFVGTVTYEKVVDAGAKIKAFFDAYAKDIDAIVIEHTVFMNSPKTAADLALVQGAILGAAGVRKIKSVAPITWQNYIGNKKPSKEDLAKIKLDNPGKSDSWIKTQVREQRKQKTIHFIEVQYDRIVKDNDVADAIGIGHYAINNWERLTK